jgi:ankyrin repeat protein
VNSAITKRILVRAIAFSATAVFSVAIMNSLPRIREQRQRSFARATMDGNLGRVRWLRFAGAKIDARSNLGNPLVLAVSEGRLDVVRYLLDEGADVNTRDDSGRHPLAEAAYYGRLDVIKELLLRSAEINAIGAQGTALDIALNRKNTAAAELLRHHGARTADEIRARG